ncbi:MAG: hypothetical protein V3U75_12920 [Methylococcaceae bacterium]
MAGLLSRDKLLTKQELKIEKVPLEDGNFVYVKEMTAYEKDSYQQSLRKRVIGDDGEVSYEPALKNLSAKFVASTVCNVKGDLLLEEGDYLKLSQSMRASTLETIAEVGRRLNKMDEEDKVEIVKNSEAAQSGDSTSDSVKK